MDVSILIYEDNNNLRQSLNSLLSLTEGFTIIGSFANCTNVVEQVQQLKPDVILMDIDLPEITGIEAVKQIRHFDKEVQVIMLTIFDDTDHIYKALSNGANGYLLKKNISDKLVTAIREVLDGGAPMSSSIAKAIVTQIQHSSVVNAPSYGLTPREQEILQLLSQGNSHKMIAASCNISLETVRSHLKKVYDKLHVHSQTEAVSKAFKENLL